MESDLSGLCDYGCGEIALHELGNGKKCCSKYVAQCPALRIKNSKGLSKAYKEGRRELVFTIDDQKNGGRLARKKWIAENVDNVLCENSTATNDTVKRLLLELNLKQSVCKACGLNEWQGKELTLELDHENGINNDNRLHNLRFLCPNCHSQTPTFRGRGKNTGIKKVSNTEFKKVLENSKNIRQALLTLGLAPKGGNYFRAKKILAG